MGNSSGFISPVLSFHNGTKFPLWSSTPPLYNTLFNNFGNQYSMTYVYPYVFFTIESSTRVYPAAADIRRPLNNPSVFSLAGQFADMSGRPNFDMFLTRPRNVNGLVQFYIFRVGISGVNITTWTLDPDQATPTLGFARTDAVTNLPGSLTITPDLFSTGDPLRNAFPGMLPIVLNQTAFFLFSLNSSQTIPFTVDVTTKVATRAISANLPLATVSLISTHVGIDEGIFVSTFNRVYRLVPGAPLTFDVSAPGADSNSGVCGQDLYFSALVSAPNSTSYIAKTDPLGGPPIRMLDTGLSLAATPMPAPFSVATRGGCTTFYFSATGGWTVATEDALGLVVRGRLTNAFAAYPGYAVSQTVEYLGNQARGGILAIRPDRGTSSTRSGRLLLWSGPDAPPTFVPDVAAPTEITTLSVDAGPMSTLTNIVAAQDSDVAIIDVSADPPVMGYLPSAYYPVSFYGGVVRVDDRFSCFLADTQTAPAFVLYESRNTTNFSTPLNATALLDSSSNFRLQSALEYGTLIGANPTELFVLEVSSTFPDQYEFSSYGFNTSEAQNSTSGAELDLEYS